jgi:alkanesulfonate monooxygenase SsuD/methylene tetrahydromethanopterin reductase-like flavin-dependent oxidoreductase (luciferase family)
LGDGPGSSAREYAAVRVPFEERWKRLDEAVQALRALWSGDGPPFRGEFYSTEGLTLEPSGRLPTILELEFPNVILSFTNPDS